jgi:hypothetical protein
MQRTRNQHVSHARQFSGGGSCAPLMPSVGCYKFGEVKNLDAITLAVEKWQQEGLSLEPPLAEELIIARLKEIDRKHSQDVIALYSRTGGMKNGESDSHFFSLWSLDRLASETLKYDRPHILFGDLLIDSQFYCFKYENEQVSSVCVDYLNGDGPEVVTRSVEEFFRSLVTDPQSLGWLE